MKILIVGVTGMLGYSLFSNLNEQIGLKLYGTVRSIAGKEAFFEGYREQLFTGVDVSDISNLAIVIEKVAPDVVINCIGLIKQYDIAKQHVDAIEINALLPHKLAQLCDKNNAKLIHFSTDCVFSGSKGNYLESELADAQDLYGKSKHLGEVDYAPHLTLRTSIIGHELSSNVSLVDWFLSQSGTVNGFSKAIFSGLPTCVIAKMLIENILPSFESNSGLTGLYHLSVEPIDKFSLLQLINEEYGKHIKVENSNELVIDRSLNSSALRKAIKLDVPSWRDLVTCMHSDFKNRYEGLTCKN